MLPRQKSLFSLLSCFLFPHPHRRRPRRQRLMHDPRAGRPADGVPPMPRSEKPNHFRASSMTVTRAAPHPRASLIRCREWSLLRLRKKSGRACGGPGDSVVMEEQRACAGFSDRAAPGPRMRASMRIPVRMRASMKSPVRPRRLATSPRAPVSTPRRAPPSRSVSAPPHAPSCIPRPVTPARRGRRSAGRHPAAGSARGAAR